MHILCQQPALTWCWPEAPSGPLDQASVAGNVGLLEQQRACGAADPDKHCTAGPAALCLLWPPLVLASTPSTSANGCAPHTKA